MMRHFIATVIAILIFFVLAPVMAQTKGAVADRDAEKEMQSGTPGIVITSEKRPAILRAGKTRESTRNLAMQKAPNRTILAMAAQQNPPSLIQDEKPAPPKVQPPPRSASSDNSSLEPKWEIEVHGGLSDIRQTGGWARPDKAESYYLAGSGFQGNTSVRVSSWYFGDGAELLGLSSSLDTVMTKAAVKPQEHVFGFRASRSLSKYLAAEFTFDRGGRMAITDESLAQIKAASKSFQQEWERLNVPGNTPSSSVSTIAAYGGHQIFTTGAVVVTVPIGRIRPYGTAGAGVLFSGASTPDVTLRGSYGGPTATETDSVRLRFLQSHNQVLTQVLGGGIKVLLTSQFGVRLDGRLYFYRNPMVTLLDASHTNTPDAAWVVKASGGPSSVPFLQRGFGPGLDAYSTLSGPALSGFKTYFDSKMQRQLYITAGIFWRF